MLQMGSQRSSLPSSPENTAEDHSIYLLRKFWIVFLVFHSILICNFQKLAGVICENFMLMKCWKLQRWYCLNERRRGSFSISLLFWVPTFKRCFLTWFWWLHRNSHPDIFELGSYHSVGVERENILTLTLRSVNSLNAF